MGTSSRWVVTFAGGWRGKARIPHGRVAAGITSTTADPGPFLPSASPSQGAHAHAHPSHRLHSSSFLCQARLQSSFLFSLLLSLSHLARLPTFSPPQSISAPQPTYPET